MSRYYSRLSEISQKYQVPVCVIGGVSDTMWMSKFSEEYPGVSILCQSVTNLIINNTHQTDTPVHSCFDSTNKTDIALIKKQASVQEMNSVLDDVANGIARRDVWQNNPEYFYPDGKHPNREGHKILYDFVEKHKINCTRILRCAVNISFNNGFEKTASHVDHKYKHKSFSICRE